MIQQYIALQDKRAIADGSAGVLDSTVSKLSRASVLMDSGLKAARKLYKALVDVTLRARGQSDKKELEERCSHVHIQFAISCCSIAFLYIGHRMDVLY